MGMLYFLGVVGLCAIGLIWLLMKSGGKDRARAKSAKDAAHHLRRPGHHPLLNSHANQHFNDRREIWKPRRVHATEEHLAEEHLGQARWGGQTFSAKKIEFDDELEEAAGVTMTAIKYEPAVPELPKTSTSKR
jgi:hypothetical protein